MDSYERRSRFIHRFGTPLTTLKAGLALLERYFNDLPPDPRFDELLGLLGRSAHRLEQAVEMLGENLHDHPLGIQVVVPESALGQPKRAVYDLPKASPAPAGQVAATIAAPPGDDQPCVLLIE
ncbi:MAG TPA: hypothetical protein VD886_09650, partial [Herpetosiphonaceae bacterium]|nr:hypothetical protein [Herpetosiphonaceae bacterium]